MLKNEHSPAMFLALCQKMSINTWPISGRIQQFVVRDGTLITPCVCQVVAEERQGPLTAASCVQGGWLIRVEIDVDAASIIME
jgi:hypothetical protein